jgi:hypothetical protein
MTNAPAYFARLPMKKMCLVHLVVQEEVAGVDGVFVGAPNQSWRKACLAR